MSKKKKELNPEAFEYNSNEEEIKKLKELSSSISSFDLEIDLQKKQEETFYKLAIEKLFDNENIEQKTEFLSPAEVFTASKLQFLGIYADIPMLSEFIEKLEKKRISLKRKGREEIIMALQERRQEELEERRNTLLGLGGVQQ